jgi:hypothetical protein
MLTHMLLQAKGQELPVFMGNWWLLIADWRLPSEWHTSERKLSALLQEANDLTAIMASLRKATGA